MINLLKNRFNKNIHLHNNLKWDDIEKILLDKPQVLDILKKMEKYGGEPDTIGYDDDNKRIIYCDCSIETPLGNRSLCYDDEALKKRKNNPPIGSALAKAQQIGVSIMNKDLYFKLQNLGDFDLKTSSWIYTDEDIRNLGGALFCEKRYGKVFIYHNSAESYYSVRGFRGYILI